MTAYELAELLVLVSEDPTAIAWGLLSEEAMD